MLKQFSPPLHEAQIEIREGVDCSLPGLYEWQIEGDGGSYIGKTKNISTRTAAYNRNVRNILNSKPYRKSKPKGFRRIHDVLANAVRAGKTIRLIILENCSLPDLNRRERELIAERGTLNGGRKGVEPDLIPGRIMRRATLQKCDNFP